MQKQKILVFSGSIRKASVNRKLAKAFELMLVDLGADVSLADLSDYPADLYNGDIESSHGLPQSIIAFKHLIASHDGMMIATPEYNGCMPPLLVNTLAWSSRSHGNEASLASFSGKYVAIGAASPGVLGGMRVMSRLRDFLSELNLIVIPGFITIGKAFDAFAEDGLLKDANHNIILRNLAKRLLAEVANKKKSDDN